MTDTTSYTLTVTSNSNLTRLDLAVVAVDVAAK